MLFGQGMSVFNITRTRRVCLCPCGCLVQVCVWLVQECDWCYINLGMIVCEFWCVGYVHTYPSPSVCMLVCLSPAPSLGRRQSQCWGCSLAAPAASLANLGGRKALRSWPASLRVPSGRQRSPAIYIGFIPFPSTGPTHPTERKSQLHSLCPLRQYVMVHTWAQIIV